MTKALLIHASEEAAEFTQAAMKLARGDWGKKELTKEAADMAAFLLVMRKQRKINRALFKKRRAKKLKKMQRKYGNS
ncbi:hypothetical protein R6138_04588 [Ralstonia thomasii]|uniref:hypothetical protein n=1 Tax=Ralstonia thomasii TaxID=3058596 RepID=UPI0028F4CFF6|nr:hypothetical protein [Ralstonia sp. LMG 18095]CAJ0901487.1 hypothetical protein R6138_04588 [Ralstonia sp. LMG 18095]